MTCKQLIDSIVRSEAHNGYDMDADDARKLIAIAYYMGRESAAREVSDSYTAVLREQLKRANECRYRNMAMAIQGDVHYVYSGDYAGDMTSTFGPDETAQTIESLSGKVEA